LREAYDATRKIRTDYEDEDLEWVLGRKTET